MRLTGHKDHAVDIILETRNPIWCESASDRLAWISKIFSSRKHASIVIKGGIANFVGDSQLEGLKAKVSDCRLRELPSVH